MKQAGFSLVEVMVGVALTGVLLKFTANYMSHAHRANNIVELKSYLKVQNQTVAKVIQRDHRLMRIEMEEPVMASDCDGDGVCGTLTIKRYSPNLTASGKSYAGETSTVTYRNVCRELEEGFHLNQRPNHNSCVERFPCPEGQVNSIEVDSVNGDDSHNGSILNYNVSSHIQKHFAGAGICIVKNVDDNNFRVIIQAKYAELPEEDDPKIQNVHKEFFLTQVTDDYTVQRVNR